MCEIERACVRVSKDKRERECVCVRESDTEREKERKFMCARVREMI